MLQVAHPKVAQLKPGAFQPRICHWFRYPIRHECQTAQLKPDKYQRNKMECGYLLAEGDDLLYFRWDPGGWAVFEPATEVVMWLETVQFGLYWIRRVVSKARLDQSTNHVKLLYLYNCPDRVLQIAVVANKYSTLFYHKIAWTQLHWDQNT